MSLFQISTKHITHKQYISHKIAHTLSMHTYTNHKLWLSIHLNKKLAAHKIKTKHKSLNKVKQEV